MRRKDKEIKKQKIIESLLNRALVCRIGLSLNNVPYIVPMNFCYKDNALYLHSSRIGRKIDILKKNNNVCFEIDLDKKLEESKIPCNWTMKYYSVIGQGIASFLDEYEDKEKVMNIIMEKYSKRNQWKFPKNMIEKVLIIKIQIIHLSGKSSIHFLCIDQ
ncbi:MAG: pyridoxamine 5'-phosphate oxidase family protein [Candidatus Lokiarchaeota archaeon]|nr:pyridoxamine 5'-phosphate oxidase family protein [Candidatus Lokiarchaeota archaeon]